MTYRPVLFVPHESKQTILTKPVLDQPGAGGSSELMEKGREDKV